VPHECPGTETGAGLDVSSINGSKVSDFIRAGLVTSLLWAFLYDLAQSALFPALPAAALYSRYEGYSIAMLLLI
jgi:hypothetical protein